jgi:adenine/guanine/hypoxanthine permease
MTLQTFFALDEHGTTLRRELVAGTTTFMTLAYILVVNPLMLSETGMDPGAVFTATALSAALATLFMALVARLPFVLAPGMGLNAFFAYTVCLGMGYSWRFALTAVFLEGLIFLVLTATNVREAIVNCLPLNLKRAIAAGIGLFIAVLGLASAGLIVTGEGTLLQLGDVSGREPLLALGGILVTGALLARRVRGALLIGIGLGTAAGLALGLTQWPSAWGGPPSLAPVFLQFEWSEIWTVDLLVVLLTFLFVDLFDTVGTLVGVATRTGMLDERGNVPRIKQALFADAVGTTAGACLGTSTVTTYVESAAGIAEGGRTGLTALTAAGLFLLALFVSPLFLMVPTAATAPALVLVGLFMMAPVREIDWDDFSESVPAFLTILMMPLTMSIANGIAAGVLSWLVLQILGGRARLVSPVAWGVGIFFVLKFVV